MVLKFNERPSTSPFIERIWQSHSETAGLFTSMATSHWQMCVWQNQDKTYLTVRGPETQATPAFCPLHTEFIGIVFKFGTYMPHLLGSTLVDAAQTLPDASSRSVWMKGSAWQFPDYENADTFVDRLAREGLLTYEPAVEAALHAQPQDISVRSVQRRFSRLIGLTQGAVDQIERARYATILLLQGVSILDTVEQAGYFDQPHLTRSLKRLIGYTPAQILSENIDGQLSFLFNRRPG